MIKLYKSDKHIRCNACNSNDNVYNFEVFNCCMQGIQIALCLDCLEEAVSMGKMVLNSEGNVKMISIDEIEGKL